MEPKEQLRNCSPNNFEECIKCTICTVYCPVTAVNADFPGPKQAGPDGERYRLKKPLFYDETLKYCLNCKRCEVACPNNVKIGDIIQAARIKYSTHKPSLRDAMLANTDFVGSMASVFAPIVNFSLGLGVVKKVLQATMRIDANRQFPAYSSRRFDKWFEEEAAPLQKGFKNKVTYFHGCYVNYNYPTLGKDLVTLLNAMNIGVEMLDKERCCGVAKIANKCIKEAKRDGALNLASIRRAVLDNGMDVISTSSTCCFTMRDEYPHLLGLPNDDVRDHILLATRYIYRLVDSGAVKLVFKPGWHKRVAYHIPCHMQKLGWDIYSVSLMKMIPGLEFIRLPQNCCGIAGTYGFKSENYKYSQAIGHTLFKDIRKANPDIVATDCETCKWQIEMSTGYHVSNPISILADALDFEATCKANGVATPVVDFRQKPSMGIDKK